MLGKRRFYLVLCPTRRSPTVLGQSHPSLVFSPGLKRSVRSATSSRSTQHLASLNPHANGSFSLAWNVFGWPRTSKPWAQTPLGCRARSAPLALHFLRSESVTPRTFSSGRFRRNDGFYTRFSMTAYRKTTVKMIHCVPFCRTIIGI